MKKRIPYIGAVLVLIFAFTFYLTLINNNIITDLQHHAHATLTAFTGKTDIPPNFLYFYTIYFFSGFSKNFSTILFSSICIISIMVTLKYFVTYNILNSGNNINNRNTITNSFDTKKATIITLIAAMSIFLFAIPWSMPFAELYYFYKGKIPPNIWHSSTTLFLFPFALMLFWNSYKILADKNANNLFSTIVLVILNIAIKPSFVLVYICVFPLFLFFEYRFTKRFFIYIIPIAICVLYIALQYYIIYKLNYKPIITNAPEEKTELAIIPFAVWTNIIKPQMIPFSLLSSLLLPISYYLFYLRELKEKINLYAICNFVVALAIFILFIEKGPREEHGNFMWQTVICCYILFIVVILNILKKYFANEFSTAKSKYILYTLSCIFLLHFASGVFYLYRILHFKSYY